MLGLLSNIPFSTYVLYTFFGKKSNFYLQNFAAKSTFSLCDRISQKMHSKIGYFVVDFLRIASTISMKKCSFSFGCGKKMCILLRLSKLHRQIAFR